MVASAGYWLAAASQEFWMLPSATGAGNIGVYMMHIDESEALEKEGVRIEVLSAGKYKLEGAPWAPLSEEARDFYQDDVDKIYDWFAKDVATYRGDTKASVLKGYGEGRLLNGKAAVEANLVDRLGSLDDAVQRAATLANRSTGRRTTAMERARLEVV
jgi:ClpP class serine protease